MNAKIYFFRTAGLLAGALLLGVAPLRADETGGLPTFDDNYIRFSASGLAASGSDAGAQARTQVPKMGTAGIEDFRYLHELDKVTNLELTGRALPGAEDYLAQFKLAKNEVGSFEVGYKQFRTFYDGAGGFFPTNNAWLPIHRRELSVDRGRFYINATVALPKAPVFTLRYSNETRTGRKDSTIWGDSNLTGIPIWSLSSLNPVSANRKILPAYIDLDERIQTLEASVRHTAGKTTGVFSIVGTRIDNYNVRSVDRNVGELRPYPAIPANPPTLIPNALGGNPVRGTHEEGVKEDAWTFTARVETELTDNVTLYAGASIRQSDGDLSGRRMMTQFMPSTAGVISGIAGFTPGGRPAYSFSSLTGTVSTDVYTANLGVQFKPTADLHMEAGLKAEDYSAKADNIAKYVATPFNQATGVVSAPLTFDAPNWSRNSETIWSPEITGRYSGIKRVSLYGSWSYRSSPGDESHLDTHVGPSGTTVAAQVGTKADKVKEAHNNAKIGLNWSVNAMLSLRGELYTKDHENRFEGYGTSAGGLYILDYDLYGTRLSAVVKPAPAWALTTRYVSQFGKAAVTTDTYATGDSKDAKRHQLSESVTWTPNKSFYVQADIGLVYDTMNTAYPPGGTADLVIRNADNNYWNGSVLVGFAVDKDTSATLQGTYYKANNYDPALAAGTSPYGAGAKEYSVALGLARKFSERLIGRAKVGYYENRNDTTGGNTNFRGPLGYLSIDYRL